MTDILVAGAIQARHNWNRWVVDCGNCPSALAVPPGTAEATCWDCGFLLGPIVWPPDPAGIETLLAMRPEFVKTPDGSWVSPRNWEPGETLQDLLLENAEHGLVPDEWIALGQAAGGRVELLGTTDDVITSGLLLDALPADRPRPAIGA